MEKMLASRVAIVTGGGRGIGRAHALALAEHGAAVVVNDVAGESGSPARAVVDEIEFGGGHAIAYECSVTDVDAVAGLIDAAVDRFGTLDVVVNNAGILRDRTLAAMTEADFDDVVDVHLKGTWAMTHAATVAWRAAAKRGDLVDARIINTTSGTGLFGNPGQANYGAAKAGIANLTLIAAMELERYGVTVNAISPIARTRMTEGLPAMQPPVDGGFDRYDPAHAAQVVAWLASRRSSWLTGAVLRIDGTSVYRMIPWQIDEHIAYHGRATIDPSRLGSELRARFGVAPAGMPTGAITTR